MTLRASRVASAASCLPGSEKKPIVQNYTLKVSTKRNDDENTDSFSAPKNWKTKNCKFPSYAGNGCKCFFSSENTQT